MKAKKWMVLVVAVVAAGTGWLVLKRGTGNGHSAVSGSEFRGSERSVAEREFLDAVLESPEILDGEGSGVRREAERHAALASAVPACTLPTGRARHLLSDIEKPPAPQPLKEPVAADSLQFRKDYASLRRDAIRNPNSPENRAGVVSLMQARQRRLGQE